MQLLISYLWSSAAASVCDFRPRIALYELTLLIADDAFRDDKTAIVMADAL